HFGEEPCISGTKGAGTVFFSGCSLHCVYCQNYKISTENFGKEVTPQKLHSIFQDLIDQGAHNIDLVTPSHFTEGILEALSYGVSVPVIYNSSGYDRVETIQRLKTSIDIYLPDLKYDDPALAKRYSGAEDYPEIAHKAIKEMVAQVGPVQLDKDGILRKGVIIRHLILPGHLDDTKRVIDWVSNTFSNEDVWLSLMSQYTPLPTLSEEYKELARRVTTRECTRAAEYALSKGIKNGYIQNRDSATKEYIPSFDLTGIK
ncbi:MAG: 4Fe-4S cluster-binding domain-containing protein, partial [Clostridia bacterium]|nr:4Fe-4S cluster-binding domain-containing protein [Clostridia bacterium]